MKNLYNARSRRLCFRLTRYQQSAINTVARENGITNSTACYFLVGLALHQTMNFDTDGRRAFIEGELNPDMQAEWQKTVEKYLGQAEVDGVPW